MRTILSIAGSDPSGGAGIQADLKTFGALGVYGMAVITSLTAQNTLGVSGTFHVPAEFVGEQLDAIIRDMGFDAVKTGMLADEGIVRIVAERLKRRRVGKLVVDPVMGSNNGAVLLNDTGREALVKFLFPLAFLVTPNIPEAEVLAGMKIRGVRDMERAAQRIKGFGAKNVLVKGGHLNKGPTDVLFDGREFTHFSLDRVETKSTHGTGCTLSAALAAFLAQGVPLEEAARRAKDYLQATLIHAFSLGKGTGPGHHFAPLYREIEKGRMLKEMDAALELLKGEKIGALIPEIQSNLAYALPGARSRDDVAAFPGRIIRDGEGVAVLHAPDFGASRHIANIVLTNMKYDPSKRARMNLRYDEKIIRRCGKLKLSIGSFDRAKEPRKVREREGSSLEWGVQEAIKKAGGKVPDVVFDKGGWGKEAAVRVSADSPLEVARLAVRIKKETAA